MSPDHSLRVRHAEHVMGTVVSFDVPAAFAGASLAEAVRWLHWVDARFSPFLPDSDVSRLGRGEVPLAGCVPELASVLSACESLDRASDGYFSAWYAGQLDPSGYVKGWAIERAAELLSAAGSQSHCVNGGGDVQCAGGRGPGADEPWRVGIADPLRPGGLCRVVAGTGFAVATSGVAERGAHIIDPHTGSPATELLSVTVVGPHLALADGYATAAAAMGLAAARDWISGLDGYCGFGLGADGRSWQTSGFDAYAVASLPEQTTHLQGARVPAAFRKAMTAATAGAAAATLLAIAAGPAFAKSDSVLTGARTAHVRQAFRLTVSVGDDAGVRPASARLQLRDARGRYHWYGQWGRLHRTSRSDESFTFTETAPQRGPETFRAVITGYAATNSLTVVVR